jgi:hypothetical protein
MFGILHSRRGGSRTESPDAPSHAAS